MPHSFRIEDFRKCFNAPLLNEVGKRDFWPLAAEVVTFGTDQLVRSDSADPQFEIAGITVKRTAIS